MKRCMLLVFICLIPAWVPAQTDAPADTKSKIAALEQLWNQAYKAGDTAALGSILDDAIVLVNDDGSVQTKAEFLNGVKSFRLATEHAAAAGRAGIVECPCVRKCCDCNRSTPGERHRTRQILRPS